MLRHMGYNGHGLSQRSQGIVSPIIVESRVKHEGLGFTGTKENIMITKITFVMARDIAKLVYSL